MGGEDSLQLFPSVGAAQDFLTLTATVENDQGDFADAVLAREGLALTRAEIGDEILQLAIVKAFHSRPRFLLEGAAGGAAWIMDLNHGRNAAANPAEILFRHALFNVREEIGAARAKRDGRDAILAEPRKQAAAGDFTGIRSYASSSSLCPSGG